MAKKNRWFNTRDLKAEINQITEEEVQQAYGQEVEEAKTKNTPVPTSEKMSENPEVKEQVDTLMQEVLAEAATKKSSRSQISLVKNAPSAESTPVYSEKTGHSTLGLLARITQLEGKIEEKDHLIHEQEEAGAQMTQYLEQQENRFVQLEKQLGEKQRVLEERAEYSRNTVAELTREISSNNEQVVELKRALTQAQSQLEQREDEPQQIKDLKVQVESLQVEKNYLQEVIQQEKQVEIDQLNQTVQEKNQAILQLEKNIDQSNHQVMLAQQKRHYAESLEQRIQELEDENKQLQIEKEQNQNEIGEVLVFAKKQAKQTVEEAKIEATLILRQAQGRVQEMTDCAKEIMLEVEKSRHATMTLYDDLGTKTSQLAEHTQSLEETGKKNADLFIMK